jgi:hypothetical protein
MARKKSFVAASRSIAWKRVKPSGVWLGEVNNAPVLRKRESYRTVMKDIMAIAQPAERRTRWNAFEDPKSSSHAPPRGDCAAVCTVESIGDRTALCLAEVAGALLPVEFPATVIRQRGIGPGDRFLWWMSDDGAIRSYDIDTDLSDTTSLPAEREQDRQMLRARSESRISRGIVWDEYEGDSP